MEYLDFELPIKELNEQYIKACAIGEESDVDVTNTCAQIKKKLDETKKDIYKNLTPWQRVQLSRHPNRPYTLDYIIDHLTGLGWNNIGIPSGKESNPPSADKIIILSIVLHNVVLPAPLCP